MEGSSFPVVLLVWTQSIDCEIPAAQLSVEVMVLQNSDRVFGSLAFNTLSTIEMTVFLEVTALDDRTPITTLFIFL